MARTPVAVQNTGSDYPATLPLLTFVACDNTNGNSVPINGQTMLIFHNTDASPHTVTISSTADDVGRTSDITGQSIAATGNNAGYVFTPKFPLLGWQQADGNLYFTTNSALVFVAALNIQN